MRGGLQFLVRFLLVVVFAATFVVPSFVSPARAIEVPVTLTKSVRAEGAGTLEASFAPTHVAFSWRGPERTGVLFRIWKGDDPSRWRRAPEAHDMEYGDHHFTGVLSVPRPTSVQWRKAGKHRARMSDIVVDGLNTVDGPTRRTIVPATAEAATGGPDIITRRQWGADESIRRGQGCSRSHYRVQQLFVHHTVGINHDPHPKATMRSIYWYHTVRRGWCDIGYNFVISPNGQVFEGRFARRYSPGEVHDGETRDGKAVSGAHVASYNSGSVGVSLMGNYSQVRPSKKMRSALVNFLAWEARRHNLKPLAHHTYRNPETGLTRWLPVIAGHRDAGSTECPGNYVYRGLPSIRRSVAEKVTKKASELTLTATPESITYGDTVELTGALTKRDGTRLGDRLVVLKRRKSPEGRWRRVQETRTGVDGSFAFTAQPLQNGLFKAVFPGDPNYRSAASDNVFVPVRAAVSLEIEGGTIDEVPQFSSGDQVVFTGAVQPPHVDGTVFVVIKKLNGDVYQVVDERQLTLDDGSAFSEDDWVGDPGSYRVRARFPRDGDHARGLSPELDFVITP